MSFRVRCTCGRQFGVKDQYAGRRGKCPHCGASLVLQPDEGPARRSSGGEPDASAAKGISADKAEKKPVSAGTPDTEPTPVRIRDAKEVSLDKGGKAPAVAAEYRHVVQRFCHVCGTRFNEGASRCSNCMAPLSEQEMAADAKKKKRLLPWLPRLYVSKRTAALMTVGGVVLVAAVVYACMYPSLRRRSRLRAELTLVENVLQNKQLEPLALDMPVQPSVSDMGPPPLLKLTREMPGYPWHRPATVKAIGKWERAVGPAVFTSVGTGTYDLDKRELLLTATDGGKTYTYRAVLRPALVVAALAGDNRCVRLMLRDPGANVDQTDSHGNTPLLAAAGAPGDPYGTVELLLDHGADPHIRNAQGKTPKDLALVARNQEVLKVLDRGKPIPRG
jgi:hypothetical protein